MFVFFCAVDLRTIGIADSAIIVDKTPPNAGVVMDGPIYGEDLMYTKYPDRVNLTYIKHINFDFTLTTLVISYSSISTFYKRACNEVVSWNPTQGYSGFHIIKT